MLRGEAIDYCAKLRWLKENFDEATLHDKYLPKYFRCQSKTQSYNILNSHDFGGLRDAIEHA